MLVLVPAGFFGVLGVDLAILEFLLVVVVMSVYSQSISLSGSSSYSTDVSSVLVPALSVWSSHIMQRDFQQRM